MAQGSGDEMVANDLPCPYYILQCRQLNHWHVPVNRNFLFRTDGIVREKGSQGGVCEGWGQVFRWYEQVLVDNLSEGEWGRWKRGE